MVLETHMKLGWQSWISWKEHFAPKIGKMGQKWAKNRVFRIHWKIWSLIFTEVVLYENLYYSLCSCINPIFGKMLVPEIWAKMFSANQIAEFLNQTYLKTNQWNSLMFCMLVQIQKTKIWSKSFDWAWSKMGVASLVMGL